MPEMDTTNDCERNLNTASPSQVSIEMQQLDHLRTNPDEVTHTTVSQPPVSDVPETFAIPKQQLENLTATLGELSLDIKELVKSNKLLAQRVYPAAADAVPESNPATVATPFNASEARNTGPAVDTSSIQVMTSAELDEYKDKTRKELYEAWHITLPLEQHNFAREEKVQALWLQVYGFCFDLGMYELHGNALPRDAFLESRSDLFCAFATCRRQDFEDSVFSSERTWFERFIEYQLLLFPAFAETIFRLSQTLVLLGEDCNLNSNHSIWLILEIMNWRRQTWTLFANGHPGLTLKDLRYHTWHLGILQVTDDQALIEVQNGFLGRLFLDTHPVCSRADYWARISCIKSNENLSLPEAYKKADKAPPSGGSFSRVKNLDLPHAEIFDTAIINLKFLQGFCGLRVRWTNIWDDHLVVDSKGEYISIFWRGTWVWKEVMGDIEPELFEELAGTYNMLFAPSELSSLSFLSRLFRTLHFPRGSQLLPWPAYAVGCNDDGFPWTEDSIHENSLRDTHVRSQLRRWQSFPLPPTNSSSFKGVEILDFETPHDVGELLRNPDCELSQDVRVMLYCMVAKSYLYDVDDPTGIRYERFERFESNIRELQAYVDYVRRHKHTLKQMWKDRRDANNWWTFWLVIAFGIATLVLSIAGLALSAVQVWTAVKGLD